MGKTHDRGSALKQARQELFRICIAPLSTIRPQIPAELWMQLRESLALGADCVFERGEAAAVAHAVACDRDPARPRRRKARVT